MKSTLIFLLALASSASAMYKVQLRSTDGRRGTELFTQDGTRMCVCTRDVQTGSIKGNGGGDIKLFKSLDCTGSYVPLGSNSRIDGATWVMSMSFGKSGISSTGPQRDPSGKIYCPTWY